MTYRYNQTSIYGLTEPEKIIYGDGWIYGAVLPTANVAVPKNVYVLHEKDYNIISWEISEKENIAAYIVYKSKTYGHNDATIIAEVTAKDNTENIQTCYIDYLSEEELDVQYYYSIEAINSAGFKSYKSQWQADINQDTSFAQYSYLYTDGMTQTYWNMLDLYKHLGNFDTDRNVIPFRDLGVEYKEENGVRVEEKKDCKYLYATLLNLTEEQKTNFSNLNYKLYIDNTEISSNKPNIVTSVYSYETDNYNLLKNLTVNKNTFIPYFMQSQSENYDLDYGSNTITFNYISKMINEDETLRVLNIDRNKLFKKILEINDGKLPTSNNGNANIVFNYNGKINDVDMWSLHISGNDTEQTDQNVNDYGISYSVYSKPIAGVTKIEIFEYWEYVKDDDTNYANTIFNKNDNTILHLQDLNENDLGVRYTFNILRNNVSFVVDAHRLAFVYFRVPYIYNSKILQTYIKETGITGNTFNRINFKTYNYLIFPSTIGKIFNAKDIELRQLKGNLYKTDASNDAIYRNFGSYFNFIQPAWMSKDKYRDCVLGSETVAGLLTAGVNGGTLEGIKQVINSYSQGYAQLTDQSDTEYLTVYDSLEYLESNNELPTVLSYNKNNLTQNDIFCVSSSISSINNGYTLRVIDYIPSDSDVELVGSNTQTSLSNGSQISIESGFTSITTPLNQVDYLITDCELTDSEDIDKNIESDYYLYVDSSIDSAVEFVISDTEPNSPQVDDYWFNTNSISTEYQFKTMYKYNGSIWEEYTDNLICKLLISSPDNYEYYYYINDTINTVTKGLYQLVEIEDNYFINVNSFFKDKKYSVVTDDLRIAIKQLIGINWVTIGYDVPNNTKKSWIFLSEYNDWISGIMYYINEVVIYKGEVYICLQNHLSSEDDFSSQDYWRKLGYAALSYTHNYIINTLNNGDSIKSLLSGKEETVKKIKTLRR